MPVTGTPTTPYVVSVDKVRLFLRDKAENNILLDKVQFTQVEVNNAVELAVSAYNAVPPYTQYEAWNFPNQYVLLLGATRMLLQSESLMQARNQASVQDGDIPGIGIDDKAPLYSGLVGNLRQEWAQMVRELKTAINAENSYGRLGSGYRVRRPQTDIEDD